MARQRMHYEIEYQRVKEDLTRFETVGHEIIYLSGKSDTTGSSDADGHARTETSNRAGSDTTQHSSTHQKGGKG